MVRGNTQTSINQQERVPMSSLFVRLISRLLIVCMIGLPFQASAGMIGTDQAVSAAQAQAARGIVVSQINRADVAGQLQSFGLTPKFTAERVAALTDAEVAKLAGQIESLPAGGNIGAGVVAIILIAFLGWWMYQK